MGETRKIGHIAIVVPDINNAMDFLTSLGIPLPPAKNFNLKIKTTFRGKEVDWDCIITRGKIGSIGLELIQPTKEGTPYYQFLITTGGGIHHISLIGADITEDLVCMEKNGAKVISDAIIDRDIVAAYLEVEKMPGVVFELLRGES